METKEKVLQVMKEAGEPLNAGKIAELSGIDRKEVDKAMKQLTNKHIPQQSKGLDLISNPLSFLCPSDYFTIKALFLPF